MKSDSEKNSFEVYKSIFIHFNNADAYFTVAI